LCISLFIIRRSGAKYPLCIQNIIELGHGRQERPRDDDKYGNSRLKRRAVTDQYVPGCHPFLFLFFCQLKISSNHKVLNWFYILNFLEISFYYISRFFLLYLYYWTNSIIRSKWCA
jgi:hypothetical protein